VFAKQGQRGEDHAIVRITALPSCHYAAILR